MIRKNTTCSTRAPVPSVTSEMTDCREEERVPGEGPGSLASQGGWEQCLFINTNWHESISSFSQLDEAWSHIFIHKTILEGFLIPEISSL